MKKKTSQIINNKKAIKIVLIRIGNLKRRMKKKRVDRSPGWGNWRWEGVVSEKKGNRCSLPEKFSASLLPLSMSMSSLLLCCSFLLFESFQNQMIFASTVFFSIFAYYRVFKGIYGCHVLITYHTLLYLSLQTYFNVVMCQL